MKQDLKKMFPPYTKEKLVEDINGIKNATHLTTDEKITHLETLKTMVIIGSNPVVQVRRMKKFMKSIS